MAGSTTTPPCSRPCCVCVAQGRISFLRIRRWRRRSFWLEPALAARGVIGLGACAETGALAVMGGEVSCGVRRLPKRQPRVPGAGTSAFAGVVHFVWTKYGRSFDATPQGRLATD